MIEWMEKRQDLRTNRPRRWTLWLWPFSFPLESTPSVRACSSANVPFALPPTHHRQRYHVGLRPVVSNEQQYLYLERYPSSYIAKGQHLPWSRVRLLSRFFPISRSFCSFHLGSNNSIRTCSSISVTGIHCEHFGHCCFILWARGWWLVVVAVAALNAGRCWRCWAMRSASKRNTEQKRRRRANLLARSRVEF